MAEFNAEVFQNEYLPEGGTEVHAVVTISCTGAGLAGQDQRDGDAAEADSRAHSITRWLGADSHDPVARCASLTVDSPGWLLACSDGLWNYCSPAEDLRRLVAATVEERGSDPVALAQGLIDFANGQGGHDNITVALARVPAASD